MAQLGERLDLRSQLAPLEADGPSALRALRRALSALLGSLPPVARAVELGERLKLDRSLAWKVWRVAQGPDDLPSPKHVPGRAAMATFLKAAAANGAPRTLIDAARDAHARLESVFKDHAGDRASAEILLGRFTDEGRSRLEIQLRRESFRASSHFLGVRMRTRHELDVLAPSPGNHMPQLARVRGYYGLQRTRTDARWVLSRGYVLHDRGPTDDYKRTALEPGANADPLHAVPIAARFCSPSDLPLRREPSDGHTVVDELGPGPIGEAGAADIVTAELISEIPYRSVSEDTVGVHVRTPAERLCYEVLIHQSLIGGATPRLEVFTTLNASVPQATPDPRDRIPILESIRALGPADTAPPAVEVPRHAELTAWMFDRLGWNPRDFLAFRFSMRFPPIAIVVRVTYPVPRPPAE